MDVASQQKILGYFIEEAKEHLETLERGILKLTEVVEDTEKVNELFRAAHSVKGGAAMLGHSSIQKTAHRLEDAFKIVKDNPIKVDETLKSYFLGAYDTLQLLLSKLQSPQSLTEEDGTKIVLDATPQFEQLEVYLDSCIVTDKFAKAETFRLHQAPSPVSPVRDPKALSNDNSTFGQQSRMLLLKMLDVFRKGTTTDNRQQLQQLCIELGKLNRTEQAWQTLLKAAYKIIANPSHSFSMLAPVILSNINEAANYVERKQPEKITLHQELQNLISAPTPYFLVPLEPEEAAQILRQAFNEHQLSQLKHALDIVG